MADCSARIKGSVREWNYKDDFSFSVQLSQAGENIAWPQTPFEIVIDGSLGKYTASYDGKTYTHCSVTDDVCTVYVNDHTLGKGMLTVTIYFNYDSPDFPDGKLKVTVDGSSLTLIDSNACDCDLTEAVISASVDYAVVDAYRMAQAAGYTGTRQEFLIALRDFVSVINGKLNQQWRDRGPWSLETAQSDPYRNDYEVVDGQKNYFVDYVWHYGVKWRCLKTGTLEEPQYGATDWLMVEGSDEYTIRFTDVDGFPIRQIFRFSDVNIDVYAQVWHNNENITSKMLADGKVSWIWSRDTGDSSADLTWQEQEITHVDGLNTLALRVKDMGSRWGNGQRSVTFTLEVTEGSDTVAATSIRYNT